MQERQLHFLSALNAYILEIPILYMSFMLEHKTRFHHSTSCEYIEEVYIYIYFFLIICPFYT